VARNPDAVRGTRIKVALALLGLLIGVGLSGIAADASSADVTDPVLMAAGDIACDPLNGNFNGGNGTLNYCRAKSTSDLVSGSDATAVAVLGDQQYACGSLAAFQASYDLSWGRFKSMTHPTAGNHEYQATGGLKTTGCGAGNTGAAGYYAYFGAAAGLPGQGYYSYDLGTWHIVVLNSNCGNVACGPTSPQGQWLQADLAAHANTCTMAYFHHPLFAVGGGVATIKPLWDMLYAADVDVVLNGHVHHYERWKPLDPSGNVDPTNGIREFVVGTGGEDRDTTTATDTRVESFNQTTFGVLRMVLSDGSYSWQFLPESGYNFTDSGTASCDPPPDSDPPSQPTGLTGAADSATQVSLSWTASSDNIGVTSYQVLRDGIPVGTSTTTQYTDKTTSGDTSYSYQVVALDAAGNASTPSDTFPVTTPTAPPPIEVLRIPVSQDAHVNASTPRQNRGTVTPFVVDGSPNIRAFLRFPVTGVNGRSILSAQLHMYVADASPSGGSVFRTNGANWTETGLTWNNQPGLAGSAVTTIGSVTAGSTRDFDVTPAVTGDGTIDLAITSTNADSAGYASKETPNSTRRPVLVVTVQ